MLGLFALVMLAPLYLVIVNAFKPESAIRQRPFSAAPGALSTDYLRAALSSPDYNIIKSFGVTVMFVVLVNVLSLALAGPASYVIARGTRRWHKGMLLVFLAGLFIPGQVLVIPVIYVLRFTGLMGTIPGFVLYEATLTLPLSMFLFVGYIKSIPRELDEAAQIDGAGLTAHLLAGDLPADAAGRGHCDRPAHHRSLDGLREPADRAGPGIGSVHRDDRRVLRDRSAHHRPVRGLSDAAAGDRTGADLLRDHAAQDRRRPHQPARRRDDCGQAHGECDGVRAGLRTARLGRTATAVVLRTGRGMAGLRGPVLPPRGRAALRRGTGRP